MLISERWRVLGASVVGSSHLASNIECQDAYNCTCPDNSTLVLAVSDGAGSASRAHEGSNCAVQSVTLALCSLLAEKGAPEDVDAWKSLLEEAVRQTRAALEQLAASCPTAGRADAEATDSAVETGDPGPEPGAEYKGETAEQGQEQAALPPGTASAPITPYLPGAPAAQGTLSDYTATLLACVVTPGWIAAAQLGDGAIVARRDGGLTALTRPQHGEYLNESFFLTDSDYMEHLQYAIEPVGEVTGIAMLTDGLQMLALTVADNYKPFAPFFDPLFAYALRESAEDAALGSFLASQRVCSRTDDDKTLVLAVRL